MLTSIVGGLTALAAIVGAVWGLIKYVSWKAQTTPEQQREQIDADVAKEKDSFERTGRP